MSYDIDDNIPPPKRYARHVPNKYPFKQLQVGQSFYVPPEDGVSQQQLWGRLRSAMHTSKLATGFKFILRTWEGGIRVWRIK